MLIVFILIVLLLIFVWHRHNYSYWKRHNVKYVKPLPFIGNCKDMVTLKNGFLSQLYHFYKTPEFDKEPVIGLYMFNRKVLLIRDLDLIKHITIKKFNNFACRSINPDPIHDPIGYQNLGYCPAALWKDLRSRLSPVFTNAKTKEIYPLMLEIAKELEVLLDSIPNNGDINLLETFQRFTTDLIASTAFGIKVNSLKDHNNEFLKHTTAIFELTIKRGLEFACFLLFPWMVSILRIKFFSAKTTDYMHKVTKNIISEREKTGIVRNDLIDKLIQMKKEAVTNPKDPANDIYYLSAQTVVMAAAGYETSSSAMTFCLYELAKHPQVQDHLRAEIKKAFEQENGGLSFEKIQEMTYLNQVLEEALRLYPLTGIIERQMTPYNENKTKVSLQPYLDYEIPKGIPIYISNLGIHRDEKYWSNPLEFIPERFSAENRHNLNMDAYMPFGVGPRNCIGMRWGLLQAKLGLIHVLHKHKVSFCEKTPKNIEFDPKCFLLTSKEDIYLKLEKNII